ncbi:hypothetical protein SLEP1_g41076 [Rubroshorea leprosula]|uniref:Ras-related protein Rab7 n=1 Tax=Rubroshorea leprosula TaxID=152421 RepID=A0AAV5L5D3_9ROSI|nr:hypothetical protein SLEP1_g41076 [Rubroshorea leprosula]
MNHYQISLLKIPTRTADSPLHIDFLPGNLVSDCCVDVVSILINHQANPADPRKFPFILLGNKIDIDGGNSRVVSEKKAKDWCASKGNIPYFETSAKEDYNVDDAFLCIAKTTLANENQHDIYFQGIPEAVSETEHRGGCAC